MRVSSLSMRIFYNRGGGKAKKILVDMGNTSGIIQVKDITQARWPMFLYVKLNRQLSAVGYARKGYIVCNLKGVSLVIIIPLFLLILSSPALSEEIPESSPGATEALLIGQPQSASGTSSVKYVYILESGMLCSMDKVLELVGRDSTSIRVDNFIKYQIDGAPLLVIPSRGLLGIDISSGFNEALAAFVSNGGNVLVMGQWLGKGYMDVPGELDGCSWFKHVLDIDDTCYIDTWSPVFAGQKSVVLKLDPEGYFTKYPKNAKVLLRKTSNDKPVLLYYPYGKGHVIATTLCPDNSYCQSRLSGDERRLVRDIVSWAVSPGSMPSARPGRNISINLLIKNYDDSESATAAEIELYAPGGKESKYWIHVPVKLAPGESAVLPITYLSKPNDPTGIYRIEYGLMTEGYQLLTSEEDPEGVNCWLESLLQPAVEDPSGRFALTGQLKNR